MSGSVSAEHALQFSRLWARAEPSVAGFVHGVVPDRAACEDILQETSLAAFSSFSSFDQTRNFAGWVIGIAKHKVHNHWHRLSRNPAWITDAAALDNLESAHASGADSMEEERLALRECLRGLKGRTWEILRLRYDAGHEPSEIAETLKLSAVNVRVILNRIRVSLRACIEQRLNGTVS